MTKTGNGISEMKKIDETDNYKYLGVYLSRNLKPTHHFLKYLKENLENKLNGMVRILGKHGGFNRVEFGNALWTSVIRPCIAHWLFHMASVVGSPA